MILTRIYFDSGSNNSSSTWCPSESVLDEGNLMPPVSESGKTNNTNQIIK